jgi:hypothetical protein
MKRQAIGVAREILRNQPGLRRGLKIFALIAGLTCVSVGLLTAWLAYMAFGQLQNLWNSPTGEKIVTTTTEQTDNMLQALQAPACQNELMRFFDPQVWLIEGVESDIDKAKNSCSPGLAKAEEVLKKAEDAEG